MKTFSKKTSSRLGLNPLGWLKQQKQTVKVMTLKTTIEINPDLVIKQEIPFSTDFVCVVIKAENIQEFLTTLNQRIQDAAS